MSFIAQHDINGGSRCEKDPSRPSGARNAGANTRSRRCYVCENCFGPLEVTYDYSGLDPAEAKRRIQAGSAGIWRYADFLPFDDGARDGRSALEPGLTPLVRADRLAERLGLGEVWVKNDAANPTHSFKDRVVAVALAKARGARVRDGGLRLHGQPGQLGRRARRRRSGSTRTCSCRPTSRSRSCSRPASTARTLVGVQGNYDDVNRLCTELCEDAAVGVREREPPPVLRRGLEDARLRDRRAARLELPDRVVVPDRVGLALHEDRPRLQRVARARAGRGRAADVQRRPGGTAASPVAEAFAAGRDVCKPQRPDTIAKSLAIGDPADGPYALDLARADRRRRRLGHRRRRSATASACSRRRPASSPRPPAASRSRSSRSWPSAARSTRRARRRRDHRRGPEDPRRGPRGLRDDEIEPTLEAFEAIERRVRRLAAVAVERHR